MNKFPCYIHIEKCAGTTLHHTLKYNFPGYIVLKPWYYWSNEKENHLSAKELKRINQFFPILSGIGGHTARTYAGYENIIKKPISYFTFVREPIARYMSHYNHQVNKMGIDWTIEEFVDENRFNNFITRRIAEEDDLTIAKNRLIEDYDFVGLFENFNESLVMLEHFTFNNKTNLFYEHKNDSKDERKLKFADLSKSLQEKVKNNNQLDIELYEFIKKQIYPQQISNYPTDISKDLEEFEKKNQTYKYNKLRHNILRGSKLMTDKIIQKFAHQVV